MTRTINAEHVIPGDSIRWKGEWHVVRAARVRLSLNGGEARVGIECEGSFALDCPVGRLLVVELGR